MKFLSEMFPEQKPLFVSVAEAHGYGEILDQLVEKAFAKGEVVTDLRAVQAILLVASMRCGSNYCSVFHSLIMNTLGVDPEQIEYVVSNRRFPDSLAELQQYDELLTYAFFRKNVYVNDDYAYISTGDFLGEAPVRRDFLTILLLSDLLLMLTVAFDDEVSLDIEPFFQMFPTHDHIDEYVKFFTAAKTDAQDGASPVFCICMHCKQIENQKTGAWQPIELVVSQLPANARFSHGMCEPCLDTAEAAL